MAALYQQPTHHYLTIHKSTLMFQGDAGSASPTTGAASIAPQKATFTLERSGRTIRSLAAGGRRHHYRRYI